MLGIGLEVAAELVNEVLIVGVLAVRVGLDVEVPAIDYNVLGKDVAHSNQRTLKTLHMSSKGYWLYLQHRLAN